LTPQVLRRRLELRQQKGLSTQEASEFEHPASRRPEEQVVIEESGVDRVLEEELVAACVAADIDDRNPLLVEHPEALVGVVHLDLGLA
jgi:hypothetical protein